MNNFVVYEQPVAENIRSFLKCEYLHEKINSSLSLESIWSIKSSISALLEMSDFSQRINLKVELLKELEKISFTLQKLNEDNEIELSKFDVYKTKVDRCLASLNNINDNPSKTIIENDFLMLIKSKLHIPAGDNFFDMPSYLNFLTSKKNHIIENINIWSSPFSCFFDSSKLVLDFKRRSSKFDKYRSNKSYFEKKLDKNVRIDLVRIRIEKDMNIYPDISVNRQNINAVFKTAYGDNRVAKTIVDDIEFELSLSILT